MAELFEVADRFRSQLLAGDAQAQRRLVAAYVRARADAERELNRLLRIAEQRRAQGQAVSRGWLYREARLGDLLAQFDQALDRFGPAAAELITKQQRDAAAKARGDALKLVDAALGRTAPTEAKTAVLARFERAPEEAIQALVGFLADGTPLAAVFRRIGGSASGDLQAYLVSAFARGRNPLVIARESRHLLDAPLWQAQRLARTETLRAYRESTRHDLEANPDVVEGWVWHAKLDARTCPACWAMHGTRHGPDERLDGHPNCRCAMLPRTRSWAELGFPDMPDDRAPIERGTDAFLEQPEHVQRAVLGPAGFRAFQRGEVKLVDFLARRDSPTWGTMRYARSLRAIKGGYGGQWLGEKAQGVYKPAPAPQATVAAQTQKQATQAANAEQRAEALRQAILAEANRLKAEALAALDRIKAINDEIDRIQAVQYDTDEAEQRATDRVRELQNERRPLYGVADQVRARQIAEAHRLLLGDDRANFTVNKQLRFVGDDRQKLEAGLEFFRRLVGPGSSLEGNTIRFGRVTKAMKTRSHYLHTRPFSTINLEKGERARTTVHELGHWLEYETPGLQKEAGEFVRRRTAGEQERKLSEITGSKAYADHETAKPDRFYSPYVGKVYPDGATEVVSMGLDKLYWGPHELAEEDPEYFDWLLIHALKR